MANIYTALSLINKEIEAIGKNRTNQQQGFKFRGIDDIMNELHGLFAKHEVIIFPNVLNIQIDERTTKNGGVLFYTHLTVNFNFASSDGSYISTTAIGEAMDSGDKGTNKAMSIALKYILLQMFLIPTEGDKDPDTKSHEVSPKKQIDDNLMLAVSEAMKMTTTEELQKIWISYPEYHKNAEFVSIVTKMKSKLSK
jgi:hypothetical protein